MSSRSRTTSARYVRMRMRMRVWVRVRRNRNRHPASLPCLYLMCALWIGRVLVFAESPKAFFVSVARALSGVGGWRRARGAGVAGVRP